MTVQMPLNTVDSEVYVKTPRGHSAVTMDPWTFIHLEEALEQIPHPQQGDQGQTQQICTTERHTEVSVSTGLPEDKGHTGRRGWSPRPTKKYNPRALGFISGPCPFHFSRQVQLNKIRKEEDEECSPNPRKRAREATPFTTHEAPLEISSDEEKDQDKTSPTSSPDHERGHPTVHEYQPKSLVYPPPGDSSDDEDLSSMPDLVTPEEGMSPVTDHSNDSGYETHNYVPADDNANQGQFPGQGQTEDPGSRPSEGTAQSPLEEVTSHRTP